MRVLLDRRRSFQVSATELFSLCQANSKHTQMTGKNSRKKGRRTWRTDPLTLFTWPALICSTAASMEERKYLKQYLLPKSHSTAAKRMTLIRRFGIRTVENSACSECFRAYKRLRCEKESLIFFRRYQLGTSDLTTRKMSIGSKSSAVKTGNSKKR